MKEIRLMLITIITFIGMAAVIITTNDVNPVNKNVMEHREKLVERARENYKGSVEEVTTQIVEVAPAQQTVYVDVDIPYDIQEWIIDYCYERNISPYLVMAIIEVESGCNARAEGDDGQAIGYMQIQPRWHQERIDKLGVTDLRNPYQNIKVGVDILLELFHKNPSIDWVLHAYNGGEAYANELEMTEQISEYASAVMRLSYELEGVKY